MGHGKNNSKESQIDTGGGLLLAISHNLDGTPYKYSGKEWDALASAYDFGARFYTPTLPRWTTMDPMAEKYYSLSPYVYCAANPVNLVDPEGQSTWVYQDFNGIYRVLGGDLNDNDLNIYEYTQDENGEYTIRGKAIGQSAFITSFYDSDSGEWALNSNINLSDLSGENFINDVISNTPSLFSYIYYARGGKKYDFKTTNGTDEIIDNSQQYAYRGMPVYGKVMSGRDVGNFVAGYMAGVYGLPYSLTRLAFDAYQSFQTSVLYNAKNLEDNPYNYQTTLLLEREGISSRTPQKAGWLSGQLSRLFKRGF